MDIFHVQSKFLNLAEILGWSHEIYECFAFYTFQSDRIFILPAVETDKLKYPH